MCVQTGTFLPSWGNRAMITDQHQYCTYRIRTFRSTTGPPVVQRVRRVTLNKFATAKRNSTIFWRSDTAFKQFVGEPTSFGTFTDNDEIKWNYSTSFMGIAHIFKEYIGFSPAEIVFGRTITTSYWFPNDRNTSDPVEFLAQTRQKMRQLQPKLVIHRNPRILRI